MCSTHAPPRILNLLQVLLVLSCWTPLVLALSSPPPLHFPPVERMTIQEYQSQRQLPDGPASLDRPILITNAMPELKCEELCQQWIEAVGTQTIAVQRRRRTKQGLDSTQLYDCTVAQTLDLLMQSTQNDSIFAFVEGLLESPKQSNKKHDIHDNVLDGIQIQLRDAREALFAQHHHDSTNWFDYFPDNAKPSDCVVLAGEGATSTLHRDPFEWTGTSLCLEGRKIWRFLSPHTNDNDNDDNNDTSYSNGISWDETLQSYRLNSMAWDGGNNHPDSNDEDGDDIVPAATTLSAGWQSDLSLYLPTTQQKESLISASLISARQLADLPEPEAEQYLDKVSSTVQYLTPHNDIVAAASNHKENDNWSSCCSVVQHPGELLLIPPYWYHQTYAPEPSLAVASQRCGSSLDATRVLNHVLSLQSEDRSSLPPLLQAFLIDGAVDPTKADPEATVKELFEFLRQSI